MWKKTGRWISVQNFKCVSWVSNVMKVTFRVLPGDFDIFVIFIFPRFGPFWKDRFRVLCENLIWKHLSNYTSPQCTFWPREVGRPWHGNKRSPKAEWTEAELWEVSKTKSMPFHRLCFSVRGYFVRRSQRWQKIENFTLWPNFWRQQWCSDKISHCIRKCHARGRQVPSVK